MQTEMRASCPWLCGSAVPFTRTRLTRTRRDHLWRLASVAGLLLASGGCGGSDETGGPDPTCAASESEIRGSALGFDGVVGEDKRAAIITAVEADGLRLTVAGEEVRFAWEGPALDGIAVGDPATAWIAGSAMQGVWNALDIKSVGLRTMDFHGVDSSSFGALDAPDGPHLVGLVADCSFPDPQDFTCGLPPKDVTRRGLELPDGKTLRAKESAVLDNATVYHAATAGFPGYTNGKIMCLREASFISRITLRIDLDR